MTTIQITDDAQSPVTVPVKWTSVSALFKYLKSELLHLIVLQDFIRLKDQTLTEAAPKPLHFRLNLGNKFQLGNTKPEIDLTPEAQVSLEVNASPGANIFEGDPFAVPATVPLNIAYLGFSLEGSLDLGVSGSAGDLTFGMDRNTEITFGYWRTFPTGANEPTLGAAFGDTLSNYVIAGDLADVSRLQQYDICAISGKGTLKVSGGIKVKASPNPLASAELPFSVGKITVQEGVIAGLTTSLAITGSYEVRVRRLDTEIVELSYFRQKGSTLKTDLSVSAGVAVDFGSTDILAKLLGAIDPSTDNAALLNGGLTAGEVKTLTSGIKSGIDHSVQASFDDALALLTEDEAAFQYQIEVHTVQSDPIANNAVHRALEGDLSLLTALEDGIQPDGTIAPGVKMLKSVFNTSRKKETTFKLNLFGLVNSISISDLIRNSKVVQDPVTGDVTITDSTTGTAINAILDPLKKQEALRKLMFDSVMVTAAYRASGATGSLGLSLHNVHSTLNHNTSIETMKDYLRWFGALNLLSAADQQTILSKFIKGGLSTCVLRTAFADPECRSLFLDAQGHVRQQDYFLDFGRRAMLTLLDTSDRVNKMRYDLLNNHWNRALEIGPNPALGPLVGLTTTDPQYVPILSLLIGDVYDIRWWASGMADAGQEVQAMIIFLSGRDPVRLANDHQFQQLRDRLQRKMATVVGRSKARFQEPWGMISLFWSAGSPKGSSAKVVTTHLALALAKP